MSKLSKVQKAKLAQLARRAWQHVGRTAAEPLPPFDDWRREQVFAACGKYGLTECANSDYSLVKARFNSLLGEDGEALNDLVRAGNEWRRSAEVVLLRSLESAGLDQSYAEAISRARFGVSVGELTDDQFKQLLYTVKSRVRTKLRKQEAA